MSHYYAYVQLDFLDLTLWREPSKFAFGCLSLFGRQVNSRGLPWFYFKARMDDKSHAPDEITVPIPYNSGSTVQV